jgi:hypothetical protein
MRGCLGVGLVDLRLVRASLDDRDLGVVWHELFRHTAERYENSGMSADPLGHRLGPARLRIGKVGGAQDGDENLRGTDLAGEPVDDYWHCVTGVIDKHAGTLPKRSGAQSKAAPFPRVVKILSTVLIVSRSRPMQPAPTPLRISGLCADAILTNATARSLVSVVSAREVWA